MSVVFADGPLAEAAGAISGRVIDGRRERLEGGCDLAVAVDPDAATLQAAWSALRPGGSCYTEWTSRTGPGPARIRRTLQAAGFTDVRSFSPRPSPEHAAPQFWIPLGVPRAIRWQARRTRTPWGTRPAARQAAGALWWRLAGWLPVATPICTVARKPPSGRDQGLDEPDFQVEVRRSIRNGSSPPPASDLDQPWVMLTAGAHSSNKVVLLALASDGRPVLAVKAPRTAAAAEAIRREAAALEQVHQLYGPQPGIPQVIFSGTCAGVPTVAETGVHGVPVSQLVHRTDYRGLALKAAQWQARLVDRSRPHSRVSWWQRVVEPVLAYVEGPLGAVVDPALVRATRAELATLGTLPRAVEQRDFSPWNVLMTGDGQLAVLDWESAEPDGLPALDLIYFLTYLAVYRERAWDLEQLRRVHRASLDPGTPIGAITQECLEMYLRMTGVDPAALRPLRVLCWLLHSWSEYCRLAAESGRSDASTLRDSTFVALWQQELHATGRSSKSAAVRV